MACSHLTPGGGWSIALQMNHMISEHLHASQNSGCTEACE